MHANVQACCYNDILDHDSDSLLLDNILISNLHDYRSANLAVQDWLPIKKTSATINCSQRFRRDRDNLADIILMGLYKMVRQMTSKVGQFVNILAIHSFIFINRKPLRYSIKSQLLLQICAGFFQFVIRAEEILTKRYLKCICFSASLCIKDVLG